MTTHQRQVRRLQVATRLMIAMAALLGLTVGLLAYPRVFPESRFDPLYLPEQKVATRVAPLRTPAVRRDGVLTVVGTKCNRSSEPVSVSSARRWSAVEPQGFIVPDGEGTGVLEPGCVTLTFVNRLSPELLAANRMLRAQGVRPKWRLTAELTPQHPGRVVRRSWRTEPFEIVP